MGGVEKGMVVVVDVWLGWVLELIEERLGGLYGVGNVYDRVRVWWVYIMRMGEERRLWGRVGLGIGEWEWKWMWGMDGVWRIWGGFWRWR